jgi:hypothetical protein
MPLPASASTIPTGFIGSRVAGAMWIEVTIGVVS